MKIVSAAIRVGNLICSVEQPGRHHDVFYAMDQSGFTDRIGPSAQGFLTDEGKFVGREEARKIAEANGQIIASVVGLEGIPFVREHPELFSEDVW